MKPQTTRHLSAALMAVTTARDQLALAQGAEQDETAVTKHVTDADLVRRIEFRHGVADGLVVMIGDELTTAAGQRVSA